MIYLIVALSILMGHALSILPSLTFKGVFSNPFCFDCMDCKPYKKWYFLPLGYLLNSRSSCDKCGSVSPILSFSYMLVIMSIGLSCLILSNSVFIALPCMIMVYSVISLYRVGSVYPLVLFIAIILPIFEVYNRLGSYDAENSMLIILATLFIALLITVPVNVIKGSMVFGGSDIKILMTWVSLSYFYDALMMLYFFVPTFILGQVIIRLRCIQPYLSKNLSTRLSGSLFSLSLASAGIPLILVP